MAVETIRKRREMSKVHGLRIRNQIITGTRTTIRRRLRVESATSPAVRVAAARSAARRPNESDDRTPRPVTPRRPRLALRRPKEVTRADLVPSRRIEAEARSTVQSATDEVDRHTRRTIDRRNCRRRHRRIETIRRAITKINSSTEVARETPAEPIDRDRVLTTSTRPRRRTPEEEEEEEEAARNGRETMDIIAVVRTNVVVDDDSRRRFLYGSQGDITPRTKS